MQIKLPSLALYGLIFVNTVAVANPHPNPNAVPRDAAQSIEAQLAIAAASEAPSVDVWADAVDTVRVQIDWDASTGDFKLGGAVLERSGTETLVARSKAQDPLGSYHGWLVDPASGEKLAYNSIGIGPEYRSLNRAVTFRFPVPEAKVLFRMVAENPKSGKFENVIEVELDPAKLERAPTGKDYAERGEEGLVVKTLKAATASPKILVNVYAEGYLEGRADNFWRDAARVVGTFKAYRFPMFEQMEVRGVFAASPERLGPARNLGLPIPEKKTFLGLYFPYWSKFERWNNIVYPTRESRFRSAIGLVPYDYPIVVVDDAQYWGVGNYNQFTAVPSGSQSFGYLLMHEFGHFLGLNEEYDGGGTELGFAPGTKEPWSRNVTFNPLRGDLKWEQFVHQSIPLPTPGAYWNSYRALGAYSGGLGENPGQGHSYKPGYACIMSQGQQFCQVCAQAIKEKLSFDTAH